MEEHTRKWPVTALCRTLVSRESGYDRYLKRKDEPGRMRFYRAKYRKYWTKAPAMTTTALPE